MPTYTYRCNAAPPHTFDKKAGFDDAMVNCIEEDCTSVALRRPYYEDTAVSFQGTGFTQTVIPPAKPQPGTIKGEPTSDWFEKLDRHAERVYRDDEDVEPYRKKQAKKMLDQMDKGGIA